MAKITTTRFGEIEVQESDTLKLPQGLIGFPELNTFVLLDHDKDSPFKWLQSLEDGALAFVLINPLLFYPSYTVEVAEAEVQDLGLVKEEDAVVSVIVTMPTNPENMTANLKAPLIFNLKNRLGKQLILNQAEYSIRHHIMDEMKKTAAATATAQAPSEIVIQERAKTASAVSLK